MVKNPNKKWLPELVLSKSAFVFDWDGTLFDSMGPKTISFGRAISEFIGPLSVGLTQETAEMLYRRYSGKPRRDIFCTIASDFGVVLSETDIELMNQHLMMLNRSTLTQAPLFLDGLQLLDLLLNRGLAVFVSSSVPQAELDFFVTLKVPIHMLRQLRGVYGSSVDFSKGNDHLNRIKNEVGCSNRDCLVFGDDPADMELSKTAGVDCILVDRLGIHAGYSPFLISSFQEVVQCL